MNDLDIIKLTTDTWLNEVGPIKGLKAGRELRKILSQIKIKRTEINVLFKEIKKLLKDGSDASYKIAMKKRTQLRSIQDDVVKLLNKSDDLRVVTKSSSSSAKKAVALSAPAVTLATAGGIAGYKSSKKSKKE